MTAIDWPTVLTWIEDNPTQTATAAILLLAVIFTACMFITRAIRATAKAGNKAAKQLDLVVVGAAGVAALATLASIEAMWQFLENELHIDDPLVRAAIVGVLDLSGVMAAVMARRDRRRRPGTIGKNSVWVWVVAIMLGYFGAAEAVPDEGKVFRFVIPLIAAFMWDSVIHQDIAAKASLDKAKISTVTGRLFSGIGRVFQSIKAAIIRTGARWGLFHPADDDTATIRVKRWRRQLIHRAAKAADALRDIEATEHLPADDKKRTKATRAYAKTVPPFRASIVAGQQLGAITSPRDLETILWESAVVIRAEDALLAAAGQSPWSTDRVEQIAPTDRTIDAEVLDQDDRPANPVDRPENDRPDRAIDRPRPTDTATDRPTEPVDREPTARPTTIDRPTRSIEPAPTARPTDTPAPADRPTGRPEAIEGEVIDRPAPRPTGRRTKEENEDLIRQAFETFLADADTIKCPSQAKLAEAVDVSKSTVQAYCGRYNITSETQITKQLIAKLPAHNVGEHI